MNYTLLITVNPVDGFTYCGPFETPEDAITHAETWIGEGWWITDMENPNH